MDFIGSWPSLDVDRIVDYFSDDGIYHNMPIDPVQGRDNLKPFIAAFLGNWTATNWDVLTIVESGSTVVAERIDHIQVGDIKIELPCLGIFEIHNGKIKAWRDYFDMATYTRPLEAGT